MNKKNDSTAIQASVPGSVYNDLINYRRTNADFKTSKPEYAIFRYSLDYKGSKYASKTTLAIDDAIVEYEKYKQWKGKKWGV